LEELVKKFRKTGEKCDFLWARVSGGRFVKMGGMYGLRGVWAGGGTTRVKRGLCPGGLPIDRDFAEDFIALQKRGRTEATWLVAGAFEASRSWV